MLHRSTQGEPSAHPAGRISIQHHNMEKSLAYAAWRPLEAILVALRGGLCRIVQVNFRECTFHALG
jgi:hypothetical protein